jgi:hypothetical protein
MDNSITSEVYMPHLQKRRDIYGKQVESEKSVLFEASMAIFDRVNTIFFG